MGIEDLEGPRGSWLWPDSLDALVAAAGNHTLLMENEHVRVVQTRILPRQTVPVHPHRSPLVAFIVNCSDLVRHDPDGNVTLDTRRSTEVPNVGGAELEIVQVEIKGAASDALGTKTPASARNKELTTIYVTLLEEGTECWRLVQAEHVGGEHFKIVDAIPDDEVWEFQPGMIVRYMAHKFANGQGLLAIEEFR